MSYIIIWCIRIVYSKSYRCSQIIEYNIEQSRRPFGGLGYNVALSLVERYSVYKKLILQARLAIADL